MATSTEGDITQETTQRQPVSRTTRCKVIESKIKGLSLTQLEELFKVLQKSKCDYTLNNNGIFLNLSRLDNTILDKIELFINFCIQSKKELDRYESICKELNDNLDVKRDHNQQLPPIDDEPCIADEILEQTTIEVAKKIAPKMSSSMKFYLLKKKFSRCQATCTNHLKYRELFKEAPLITKK